MAALRSSIASASLAARSIHIKMHPSVPSIPERQEVLRILKSFGDVQMFRSLKYEGVPNAALAIMSSEEGAEKAVEASPIRFSMALGEVEDNKHDEVRTEGSSAGDVQQPPSEGAGAGAASDAMAAEEQPKVQQATRTYEMRISTSIYDHQASIVTSPIYGPFKPVDPRRSAIAADLADRIPSSCAKPGLLDWVTDAVKGGGSWSASGASAAFGEGREIGSDREPGAEKGPNWRRVGGDSVGVPWRILKRERERKLRGTKNVMDSLKTSAR